MGTARESTLGGLRIRRLSKSFGSLRVLRGVDIDFAAGEVHALLGANGAGKSTLIACLGGATSPDAGEVLLDGKNLHGFQPKEAIGSGIAVIYQHFQLIDSLSVADNIFLGAEQTRGGIFADKSRQRDEARQVLARLGLDLDPDALVGSLSTGAQQVVEIARAVRRNPRVLILDEPTAALGKHEVEALLSLVRRLANELDIVVIYVTHLLGEVMRVADRATILRGGDVLWSRPIGQVRIEDLIEGISPASGPGSSRQSAALGGDLVELRGVGPAGRGPLDLAVRRGEIIGVFGLLGSGRTELLEVLAGARVDHVGEVIVDGAPVALGSVRRARARGIALVAADRVAQSIFPSMTALENLLMPTFHRLGRILRRRNLERDAFRSIADRVSLTPAEPERLASDFSGGNAQKLVVGRWLDSRSDVRLLLLDEPTQGVDVGSRQEIYELLQAFVDGTDRAIIFASSEPEEIRALADRVVIMRDGQPTAVIATPRRDEDLLALAQGVEPERKGIR